MKAAAGTAQDEIAAGTLAAALEVARGRHGARFAEVLLRCSYVVDGDPVGTRAHASVALGPGALVDCLPPFAGG